LGAELFQDFGPGIEVSAGYRRLRFTPALDIYTASLGKYVGAWLLSTRAYYSPQPLASSHTWMVEAKRFFSTGSDRYYFDLRVTRGASLAQARSLLDLQALHSTAVVTEYNRTLSGPWAAAARFGVSAEDHVGQSNVRRFIASGSLLYRF
jgi:YaiO family outer membrane protein